VHLARIIILAVAEILGRRCWRMPLLHLSWLLGSSCAPSQWFSTFFLENVHFDAF